MRDALLLRNVPLRNGQVCSLYFEVPTNSVLVFSWLPQNPLFSLIGAGYLAFFLRRRFIMSPISFFCKCPLHACLSTSLRIFPFPWSCWSGKFLACSFHLLYTTSRWSTNSELIHAWIAAVRFQGLPWNILRSEKRNRICGTWSSFLSEEKEAVALFWSSANDLHAVVPQWICKVNLLRAMVRPHCNDPCCMNFASCPKSDNSCRRCTSCIPFYSKEAESELVVPGACTSFFLRERSHTDFSRSAVKVSLDQQWVSK